jgi:hypothetical protein
MDNPMHYELIQQCAQSLENFLTCLDKAEQFAGTEDRELQPLLNARLTADMKPFIYQIQSACDYVKAGAAWLSGQKPPTHADDEETIDEVRERIRKTVAFVRGVPKSQFAGASERAIHLSWAPGKFMSGTDYVLEMTIPNVFFHLAMGYAILRKAGVNVGKMDFLGNIKLIDV